MKRFGLVLIAFLFSLPALSATHYVWCGSANNGDGTSFQSAVSVSGPGAMVDLPASLTRGDTYVIAGSTSCSYGPHLFADAGTTVITVRHATSALDSSVSGWQASFATTPAQWLTHTSSGIEYFWEFQASDYTIDGEYGSGTGGEDDVPGLQCSTSGYGFCFASWDDDWNQFIFDSATPNAQINNISIKHFESDGICGTTNVVQAGCAFPGTISGNGTTATFTLSSGTLPANVINGEQVAFSSASNSGFNTSAVTGTSIAAGGTGYAVNDTGNILGGTGNTATYKVTSVSSGAVTGISITYAGAGYNTYYGTIGSLATVATSGSGTGLQINVTAASAPQVVVSNVTSNSFTFASTVSGTATGVIMGAPPLSAGTSVSYPRFAAAGLTYNTNDITFQYFWAHDSKNGYFTIDSADNWVIDHGWMRGSSFTVASHGNGMSLNNGSQAIAISAYTSTGSVCTVTTASTPDSIYPSVGTPFVLYNGSPASIESNFVTTSISGTTTTFNCNVPAGSGPATGYAGYGTTISNLYLTNLVWKDVCGTSEITGSMNGAMDHLYVWGNVFYQTTQQETFTGQTPYFACRSAGNIQDLGPDFGGTITDAIIVNNTFAFLGQNANGVYFSNEKASNVTQEDNLAYDVMNMQFNNQADNAGGNLDAYNTVVASSIHSNWTGCGNVATDSCQNTTGPTVLSTSTLTSGAATLNYSSSPALSFSVGDPIIIFGDQVPTGIEGCYRGSCPGPFSTNYPFPTATSAGANTVSYTQVGGVPNVTSGQLQNGYGTVIDAKTTPSPFVNPSAGNFALTSATSLPHLDDGVDLTALCGSLTIPCTIDPNGNARQPSSWTRGAYQYGAAPPPSAGSITTGGSGKSVLCAVSDPTHCP